MSYTIIAVLVTVSVIGLFVPLRPVISLGIVSASLFLAALCAYGGINSIMLPIRKIVRETKKITMVNTEAQFENDFTDEIGLLSKTFGDVTGMLNRAIALLNKRGAQATCLNQAAIAFLSRTFNTFDAVMTNGIKKIADESDIDRVGVYRNFDRADGLHFGQIYRWDKESGGTTNIAEGMADLSYREFAPGIEEIMAYGDYLNGPIGSHPQLNQKWLNRFGVRSMLVLPILIQNNFWGLITFQDHHCDRYFDDDCVKMLRSAATMCSGAIIHQEMEHRLIESEERIRSIMDAVPLGVMILDKNMWILDVNDYLLNLYGLADKQEFNDRFFKLMPEYQPDGSRSAETVVIYIDRALNGETLTVEWVHITPSNEYIPAEITLSPLCVNGETVVLLCFYDVRRATERN